jgi:hypothetical protein
MSAVHPVIRASGSVDAHFIRLICRLHPVVAIAAANRMQARMDGLPITVRAPRIRNKKDHLTLALFFRTSRLSVREILRTAKSAPLRGLASQQVSGPRSDFHVLFEPVRGVAG